MGEIRHIERQFKLVTAIKANDERALHKLYTENFYKTEQYILKNNGTMPQAKDIYQEAFITVWRNIKDGKFIPENEPPFFNFKPLALLPPPVTSLNSGNTKTKGLGSVPPV